MKFKNKILTVILTIIIILTNLTNVFAYEWDLEIPTINGDSDIIFDNEVTVNENNDIVINDNITNNEINEEKTENINEPNNYNENKSNEDLDFKEVKNENGIVKKASILPIFQPVTLSNGDKTLTLVGSDKGADATVTFKGDEPGASPHAIIDYITREMGDINAVSYCISPFYKGAKENGTTTVKVVNQLNETDKKLLGIAIAGYPHNKYNIAGFNDLKEEDRYYATLIAMEHLIFQNTDKYKSGKGVKFVGDHWNSTRWYPTRKGDANAQNIIDLAQKIYEKGIANPYDETNIATIKFSDNNKNDGSMKLQGNNYTLTITLNSDINYSDVIISFKDPKIKEWATGGSTKIQFYDGENIDERNRLYIQNHKVGEETIEGIKIAKASRKSDKLTIVLDKKTANDLILEEKGKYTVNYDAIFVGGNIQVIYKTTNVDPSLQDYVAITAGYASTNNSISWEKTHVDITTTSETTTEPTTSTTTTQSAGGKGGLKILKYNAKTNELVAGAIFRIRGISQGVYDFNVQIQASNGVEIPLPNGGVATCKDGVIELKNINIGTYEITDVDTTI